MAKKKMGVNEKAEAARSRKEEAKQAAKSSASKAAEDAYWRDAGEGERTKAQAKREEQERKKQELAAKRAEAKRLADEELAALASSSKKATDRVGAAKVTQHQLDKQRALEEKMREDAARERELAKRREATEEHYSSLVEIENTNRDEARLDASGIDSALSVLTVSANAADADRHPEKRVRAAWLAYQEREMPALRQEKPGLKMSQYRDMLWKSWQKSPDNPINVAAAAQQPAA